MYVRSDCFSTKYLHVPSTLFEQKPVLGICCNYGTIPHSGTVRAHARIIACTCASSKMSTTKKNPTRILKHCSRTQHERQTSLLASHLESVEHDRTRPWAEHIAHGYHTSVGRHAGAMVTVIVGHYDRLRGQVQAGRSELLTDAGDRLRVED